MRVRIFDATIDNVKLANTYLTKLINDEKKYDLNINENCVVETFYENIIHDEDKCILFAKIDDEIVGYLYGFLENTGDTYIKGKTKLEAMYVDADFRGNNIGSKLIDYFIKWSKEKKAKYIELSVCDSNETAINLYSKKGFKRVKTIMEVEIDE